MTQIFNEKQLEDVLIGNPDVLIVIDFSATWCGPCKRIAPEVDKLERKYDFEIKVFKVDVDECSEIAETMKVTAMPTFIYYKNNVEVARKVGANLSEIEKLIQEHK